MIFFRLFLFLLLPLVSLVAKPKKHDVVAGKVDISSRDQTTIVHQKTHKAIVHWDSFSIEQGESVHIEQPSSKSAILNRVTGKDPSKIHGILSSTGKVFLLNKNGIVIGPQGRVNTAGFIASTLELKDSEFLSDGPLLFSGDSDQSIINLGKIETHFGNLFILAQRVENQGILKAEQGVVQVAGAREVLLKEDSAEPIYIRPQSEGVVINEGSIEGLSVIVKAAGENAYALALNQEGFIQATGVQSEGGQVFLVAEKGITQVSGEIRAIKGDGSGGTVHILGDQVGLIENAIVDVSAPNHGGEVLIGGDYQGSNEAIRNAEIAYVGEHAQVLAHSTEHGAGGKVIVWGDQSSSHLGWIDVNGSHRGGFIEVSSPGHLCYRGNVDLSSKWGEPGELLLDPSDITIGNFSGAGSSNPSFPTGPNEYNPSGSSGNLAVADLMNGLNSGNVTVSTAAGSGGNGNVTFNSGINLTWNAATTFSIVTTGTIGLTNVTIQNTHTGSGNFDAINFQSNINSPTNAGILIQGSTITSQEGNISLTGINANRFVGIDLSGGSISSTGTGPDSATITVLGSATDGTGVISLGIWLATNISSVDGDISLTGSGDDFGVLSQGMTITSTGTTANAANISLTGTGTPGVYSVGLGLLDANFSIVASAGDILLQGTSVGGTGIEINKDMQSLAQIGSATMTGDITIRASSIDLNTPAQILGLGTLTIEPSDPALTVGVGGGLAGTQDLYLPTATLNLIQNGFAERIFGRTDGTGTFDIGTYTYADPVTMVSLTGNMTVDSALATSGGSAIKLASDNMNLNSSVTGTGTLTLEPGQPSTTIGIGNSAFGVFNLNSTEIGQITNGFSGITIGRTDQDSAVDIQAITFQDPLTVYGKQIGVNGALNAGANNVTFNLGPASAGTLNLGALVTTTGTFQANGAGFNDTFNINIAGQTAILNGGGGVNTLSHSSGTNTWSISSINGGSVGSVTFTNMNQLVGGSGNDGFTFGGMFQIDGPFGINGGGGTNSVTGPNAVTSWTVTGDNAGTIDTGGGTTTLTSIQTFTGGSSSDSFLFLGDHQLTSINGVGVANSVTGPNTATTWGITSGTTGTINPGSGSTNLTNIQTFAGGSGNDLFNLSPDITIPTIQGGGGGGNTLTFLAGWTNASVIDLNTTIDFQTINGPGTVGSSLTGNNLANTWHITNNNSGTLENTTYLAGNLFNFTGFPNVVGGTNTDDFIFDGDFQLTSIDGGGGANSVTGPDTVTTWGITSSTTGTINPGSGSINLSKIQTFIGGSNDDTFNLSPDITVPTIQAGLGDNTLTFLAGWTSAAVIDLNTTTDFHTINGPGTVGSSLTGNNLANTWHITNNNSGTLENTTYLAGNLFNFTGFPNVVGGTNTDDFIFDGDFQLTSIDGEGGANSVTGPDTVTTWGITSSTTGTINPGSGSINLSKIQTFIGGSNDDTFNLSTDITVPTIQAGLGDNTLTFLAGWTSAAVIDLNTTTDFHTINGPGIEGSSLTGNNLANTWHITNNNSGTLENTTYLAGNLFNFTGFPNVVGGTSTDDFTFDSNYQLTSIDGGTGTNTLKGPDLTNTWAITGDNVGTVEPAGASGSTNFSRVGALLGGIVADNYTFNGPFRIDGSGLVAGTGTNTLTGPDVINAWRITADGTGTILPNGSSGITHFSGMGSLTGGSQVDGFVFLAPAQILNGIHGGGSQNNSVAGPNVINMWAITNNNTGTLSPSGAGTTNLTNIENFVGGSLADTFTFNANYQLEGLAGIVGNGGGNILNAPDFDNTWTVSGNNAGSIFPFGAPGVTKFSFIPQITGGSMMDTITFTADAALTLGIDGGGGTNNSVTGPDLMTTWTIDTNDNAGFINPGSMATSLMNIQIWAGGNKDNTFTFNDAYQISGGIQGGTGDNTIQGPDVATSWTIVGPVNDQGSLNPTGAVGATSFTGIGTLIGGSAADGFTFNGAARLSGTVGIQGAGGINSLTGSDLGNAWTVSGVNGGTLLPNTVGTPTVFSDIAQIIGGVGDDAIHFTVSSARLTQGVDGGGGGTNNSVTGPNLVTTWTIDTNDNAGSINPGSGSTTLTNIQQFIGGSIMDTFKFSGDFQILNGIDGGGGSNIVNSPNITTTWTINGPTSGVIDPGTATTTLTNIQTFTGGTGNDTFNLSQDITLPTIQAGLGSNTLTYLAGWTVPAIVDLTTTTGFQFINGPPGLSGNTLVGHNLSNIWHIINDDSGTLQNAVYPLGDLLTFTNFPNVMGGSTVDSFFFDGPYRLSGTRGIAAGGGSNSMTVPDTVNNWTIEGNNVGTIFPTGASGSTVFSGIPTLTGGSLDDTFQFNGAYQISGGIVGNGGTNTVIAPGAINNWTIWGNNSGALAPPLPTGPTSLNGIQNFTGGSQEDHFQFTGPYRLTSIDGGGGVNNSLTGPNTVTTWNIMTTTTGTIEPLTSPGATNYVNIDILNGGFGNDTFNLAANTAPPTVSAGSGANTLNFDPGWTIAVTIDLNAIIGFQTINATAGQSNVLIGNDLPNTWHFIANDTGTLENSIYPLPTPFSFSNFPNVTGGSDNDSFIFDSAVHLTGAGINGGRGSNSITSPPINTTWNVTSQTDGSINIGGADQTTYVNVSSLNGSSANDTFNLSPNITLPAIHADSGSNTLNFLAGWSTPVTIDLNSIQAFQTISAPPLLDNILVGNDDINQWHITNDNAGTLENTFYPFPTVFTFSNFPILTGGSLDDTFTFDGLHQVTNIEGGAGGTNTIFGPDTDNTWTVTAANSGNFEVTGMTNPIPFSGIQNLVGATFQDDFILNGGVVSQVDGGAGENSLTSLNSTWLITSSDAGSVDGMAFVNIGNLTGGSHADFFVFSDGATLSGQINGGAPANQNVLNYSAYTTPVVITLLTPNSGTASNLGNGFINIGQFVGNYTCTNCPESPPAFSPERAAGLRTDLMLALTKEIGYFEWSYEKLIFYNIYKSILNRVLVMDQLVKWRVEDRVTPYWDSLFENSKSGLQGSYR